MNVLFKGYKCHTKQEVPQLKDSDLQNLILDSNSFSGGDIQPRHRFLYHARLLEGIRTLMKRQEAGELEPAADAAFSIAEFFHVLDIYSAQGRILN